MHDVIIIGGGPCGIMAGIYAKRSGLNPLIIEKGNIGGQVINTYEIKNFPTYTNISGADFCAKLYEQADFNGIEIEYTDVVSVDFSQKTKVIKTPSQTYFANAVIICSGTKPRSLGLAGEQELIGRGISYCALCDGNFFKNKTVAVIGGGDSAMEDAIYLGGICKKVYVINRSNNFRAQPILTQSLNDFAQKNGNIQIIKNSTVSKLYSSNNLLCGIDILVQSNACENKIENHNSVAQNNNQSAHLAQNVQQKNSNLVISKTIQATAQNCQSLATKHIELDGLFLAIGSNPDTKIFEKQIELDSHGYIIVDKNQQTSVQGVFAGGDCTQKLIRQIITACADGAVCATNANTYLKNLI